jgi:hypothetical protein
MIIIAVIAIVMVCLFCRMLAIPKTVIGFGLILGIVIACLIKYSDLLLSLLLY